MHSYGDSELVTGSVLAKQLGFSDMAVSKAKMSNIRSTPIRIVLGDDCAGFGGDGAFRKYGPRDGRSRRGHHREHGETFFSRWRGLGLDDGFAILAGVFHWPYGDIMALDAESFAYSVRAAEKFLKWKSPKR